MSQLYSAFPKLSLQFYAYFSWEWAPCGASYLSRCYDCTASLSKWLFPPEPLALHHLLHLIWIQPLPNSLGPQTNTGSEHTAAALVLVENKTQSCISSAAYTEFQRSWYFSQGLLINKGDRTGKWEKKGNLIYPPIKTYEAKVISQMVYGAGDHGNLTLAEMAQNTYLWEGLFSYSPPYNAIPPSTEMCNFNFIN